jgi:hypothetical protein
MSDDPTDAERKDVPNDMREGIETFYREAENFVNAFAANMEVLPQIFGRLRLSLRSAPTASWDDGR